MTDNPYRILGLVPGASEAEINRAFRQLAKSFHPDLNPGKPELFARFSEITWAREHLNDPVQRAVWETRAVVVDDDTVEVTPI